MGLAQLEAVVRSLLAAASVVLRRISTRSTMIEHREKPIRSIAVRWCLLGVVLIAIVVYGGTGLVRAVRASGAGHDHTVFSAQLPNGCHKLR
jgi:hypothetical protein